MSHYRPLFLFPLRLFNTVDSMLTNVLLYKCLLMTGFEPRISGVGSDCSTNWATQPLPHSRIFTGPSIPRYILRRLNGMGINYSYGWGAWIAEWSSHSTFEHRYATPWAMSSSLGDIKCFIHDSIWFVWFDTIICLSNLSCELWSRKLKIKEIY